MTDIETLARRNAPGCDAWAVRQLDERAERIAVRDDVVLPPERRRTRGAMVTVSAAGGIGHAATADLSDAGLARAFGDAKALAEDGATAALFPAADWEPATARAEWRSPNRQPAAALAFADRLALVRGVCADAKVGGEIAERNAFIELTEAEQIYVTSAGARIEQRWDFALPSVTVSATAGGDTQTRSSAGRYNGFCQQGGLEVFDRAGFAGDGARVAREAIELVHAPDCGEGTMDLLLMPDQMMLQIHESIGHPLELDRILGDERNFAGTSFVTLDMFGSYRYGSELLNVTYAPDVDGEFASFGYDDDGTPAERRFLIEAGVLKRPLGGALSQRRARRLAPGIDGVATSRASTWARPTMDRMSNLNVEPGTSTLEDMIAGVEHGILMRTNASWSIDDSRNKFQFGCEWGQMIRGGKLAEVVKRPNYRGISANFWRSLVKVGDASTFQVMGTPFCGKGEPAQIIRVGHASPACLFSGVSVFGKG